MKRKVVNRVLPQTAEEFRERMVSKNLNKEQLEQIIDALLEIAFKE